MKTVILQRTAHTPDGTPGQMVMPGGTVLQTIEPPLADNKPGVSCIPTGKYLVKRDRTGRFKYYAVQDVPGRTAIEIHPANYFINPNGKQELHGCIAVGLRKMPGDLCGVANSRLGCEKIIDVMGNDDFMLWIRAPSPWPQ